MKKTFLYVPPVVEILPIQAEGPLCASGESNEIPDFDLIGSGDLDWIV